MLNMAVAFGYYVAGQPCFTSDVQKYEGSDGLAR